MYTDDLAKMYGFDKEQVETFISNAGFEIKSSFTKKVVQDSDVGPIVNGFHRYLEEEAKKQKVMSSIMITSLPSTEEPQNSCATIGLRPSTIRL